MYSIKNDVRLRLFPKFNFFWDEKRLVKIELTTLVNWSVERSFADLSIAIYWQQQVCLCVRDSHSVAYV